MNPPSATDPSGLPTEPAEDSVLLMQYAQSGSESAFAELVRRRIGLVYSVALRQTRGDRHRAEDITQTVFTDLARKAATLAQRPVIAGWLYRSAQLAAAGVIRAESRRMHRELQAHTMDKILGATPDPDWDKVRPLLDRALGEVDDLDRDAIVLRFFDGRSFAQIGQQLQLSENAARMRVDRALDKLNAALAIRGVTSTSAAVGVALANSFSTAAPAGLAASVTGAALAHSVGTGVGGGLVALLSMTKLQLGVVGVVSTIAVLAYALDASDQRSLREQIAAAREQQSLVARLTDENRRLAATAAEVELLRHDDAELKQLSEAIAAAQSIQAERLKRANLRNAQRTQEQNAQAEIDRLNREGNLLVKAYKELSSRANDVALSADERAAADVAAKAKLVEIQAKQREVRDYLASVRASNPQFQPAKMEARTLTPAEDAARRHQQRAAVDGSSGGWSAQAGEHISFRLPQADHLSALSALEIASGMKVIRDPSLAGVRGTLNLSLDRVKKSEATQILQQALRTQLNVIVESAPDGSLVAKLGPAR